MKGKFFDILLCIGCILLVILLLAIMATVSLCMLSGIFWPFFVFMGVAILTCKILEWTGAWPESKFE